MKATEFITEIEKIGKGQFPGGKNFLRTQGFGKIDWKPLPGGSGLVWGVAKYSGGISNFADIYISDPKNDATVGQLRLRSFAGPLKNAYKVDTITVDEDYRGMGLAKALYGIALSIMKITLISGESQTPGGRRNWLSLASIPGVEVKGLLTFGDDNFGPTKPLHKNAEKWEQNSFASQTKQAEEHINDIMKMGLQYLGSKNVYGRKVHYFAFDVVGGNGELEAAVKTKLGRVYGPMSTYLYAQWAGK